MRCRLSLEIGFSQRAVESLIRHLDGEERSGAVGVAQLLHRLLLQARLVKEAVADIGIVIGAVERLLEPPVQFHLRRGVLLHVAEDLEGGIDALVRDEGADPVAFQREEPLRERVAILLADEVAAEFAQDVEHGLVRIPAQPAPDELVDVVVDAFRVGQEADADVHVAAENVALLRGARVGPFASLGHGIGHVPIRHGELGLRAVGDVGIVADGISLRNARGKGRDIVARLRAVNNAAEPGGLGLHERVELLDPLLAEALRRHPHLRLRMILVQQRGLLFEQRKQVFRLGVTGIAAGHEHVVDARKAA